VDDPSTWTRPWTYSLPLTLNESEPIMQYQCHEGTTACRTSWARRELKSSD